MQMQKQHCTHPVVKLKDVKHPHVLDATLEIGWRQPYDSLHVKSVYPFHSFIFYASPLLLYILQDCCTIQYVQVTVIHMDIQRGNINRCEAENITLPTSKSVIIQGCCELSSRVVLNLWWPGEETPSPVSSNEGGNCWAVARPRGLALAARGAAVSCFLPQFNYYSASWGLAPDWMLMLIAHCNWATLTSRMVYKSSSVWKYVAF